MVLARICAALAWLSAAGPCLSGTGPGSLAYGRHLAQECASCHQLDGTGGPMPSIVGRKPDDIIATLKLYQSGARTNAVMVSVARSLDAAQMAAVAAYLQTLAPSEPPPATSTTD